MTVHGRGRWWAAAFAVTGTVVLGLGAFWLSFTALSDLARLAGIAAGQSWAWAVIVDGVIVTSTVAVVSLDGAGWRLTWFPWTLLAGSAGVSVLANVLHAVVASEGRIAPALAGAIAAVPPLVLLAMTHLTVVVVRHARRPTTPPTTRKATPTPTTAKAPKTRNPDVAPTQTPSPRRAPFGGRPEPALRVEAERLRRDEGLSNRKIALRLGVHRSTVGRWLPSLPNAEGTTRTEQTTTDLREEGVPA